MTLISLRPISNSHLKQWTSQSMSASANKFLRMYISSAWWSLPLSLADNLSTIIRLLAQGVSSNWETRFGGPKKPNELNIETDKAKSLISSCSSFQEKLLRKSLMSAPLGEELRSFVDTIGKPRMHRQRLALRTI